MKRKIFIFFLGIFLLSSISTTSAKVYVMKLGLIIPLKEELHFASTTYQFFKAKLEELISEINLPLGEKRRTVSGRLCGNKHEAAFKIGTVISRTWKGREIRAVVVEGGFEYDGVVYKSLSAVAKAVTGSHWNGRLFFGLTQRRKR